MNLNVLVVVNMNFAKRRRTTRSYSKHMNWILKSLSPQKYPTGVTTIEVSFDLGGCQTLELPSNLLKSFDSTSLQRVAEPTRLTRQQLTVFSTALYHRSLQVRLENPH